jgi:hypothetical protein
MTGNVPTDAVLTEDNAGRTSTLSTSATAGSSLALKLGLPITSLRACWTALGQRTGRIFCTQQSDCSITDRGRAMCTISSYKLEDSLLTQFLGIEVVASPQQELGVEILDAVDTHLMPLKQNHSK